MRDPFCAVSTADLGGARCAFFFPDPFGLGVISDSETLRAAGAGSPSAVPDGRALARARWESGPPGGPFVRESSHRARSRRSPVAHGRPSAPERGPNPGGLPPDSEKPPAPRPGRSSAVRHGGPSASARFEDRALGVAREDSENLRDDRRVGADLRRGLRRASRPRTVGPEESEVPGRIRQRAPAEVPRSSRGTSRRRTVKDPDSEDRDGVDPVNSDPVTGEPQRSEDRGGVRQRALGRVPRSSRGTSRRRTVKDSDSEDRDGGDPVNSDPVTGEPQHSEERGPRTEEESGSGRSRGVPGSRPLRLGEPELTQ